MALTPLQRTLFFLLAIAAAGLVVAIVVATTVPEDDSGRPESATYRLGDLTLGEPVFFRPFDMGRGTNDRPYGIWLVRLEGDEVLALFSRDRHLGQSVERLPNPPGLDTMTFGSRNGGHFYLDGRRVTGPQPRDLDRFPVTVQDGLVRIDTTQLILGECSPGLRDGGTFPCSRNGDEERWSIRWHEVRGP